MLCNSCSLHMMNREMAIYIYINLLLCVSTKETLQQVTQKDEFYLEERQGFILR